MASEKDKGSAPKHWLSLEQWRQDPDFLKFAEEEFASSPLRESDAGEGGWARREFLKLMGASMALASFGCVRRPEQEIVSYVQRPPDVIEGIPDYYASTFVDGSETFGIVVKTREGRPLHLTGNELHPMNRNGMSGRAQAHVLSLYDPGRMNAPVLNLQNSKRTDHDTLKIDWPKADKDITEQLKKGSVAILTSSIISPTLNDVMNEFAKVAGAKMYVWDAWSDESYGEGQKLSYGGEAVAPRLVVEKAKYILAVNNDFLGTWLQPTQQGREFSLTRQPGPDMSRLVVFESIMTLTGANSDMRYRIRTSDTTTVLMRVLYELLINKKVSKYANDPAVVSIVKGYAGQNAGIKDAIYTRVANDLWSHRGQSLVLGAMDIPSQVAANLLNSVLGNDGVTIDYSHSPNMGFQGRDANLTALTNEMKSGKVKTLIIHGVNPAYAAPSEIPFVEALQKVEMAIYTGERVDETGWYCNYVLPDSHPMESWGDAEGQKGVYSVQQPTIQPLYNTRAFGDTLIAWAKVLNSKSELAKADSVYSLVRERIEKKLNTKWVHAMHAGVINTAEAARAQNDAPRAFRTEALKVVEFKATPKADHELVFYPTIGMKDGTMANVTWLQEFPDPVTKICWDNFISVSPNFSSEQHLVEGQVMILHVGDHTIEAPVHIQPGQHDSVLGMPVGYGRTRAGEIGNNVGVNAYPLIPLAADGRRQYAGVPATFEMTQTQEGLPNTQGYFLMHGLTPEGAQIGDRQIVVEATLKEWEKDPATGIKQPSNLSSWTPHVYKGHKWGMSIDLSRCNGCSACILACQSENNIAVVGKTYVLQHRQMQWMRVDRYFVGTADDPDSLHIPILCMQCDNAPCETVCPVQATMHDDEGLNSMIYNRCVGTRYCSNNCPYKVRRFNWFNYGRMHPDLVASPLQMQLNPEVTVRSRGVMEKCSFCVQRIRFAEVQAQINHREVQDGEIKMACEASCPTKAIVFGDVNNPNWRVSKLLKDPRHYEVLVDLNTRPAVRYASKIRNTDKLKPETDADFYEGRYI